MIRVLTIVGLGSALLLMTAGNHFNSAIQADELEDQRITLLTERVELLQQMTIEGRIGSIEVTRAEMDLLKAQLEYSESDDASKNLINQLLEKYDQLIEVAEMRTLTGVSGSPTARADLLLVQSERVRTEIMLAGLQ
ncbi:MAG: hypothetical protein ACR2NP_02810 [Pirellulaceae bacterium]